MTKKIIHVIVILTYKMPSHQVTSTRCLRQSTIFVLVISTLCCLQPRYLQQTCFHCMLPYIHKSKRHLYFRPLAIRMFAYELSYFNGRQQSTQNAR